MKVLLTNFTGTITVKEEFEDEIKATFDTTEKLNEFLNKALRESLAERYPADTFDVNIAVTQ